MPIQYNPPPSSGGGGASGLTSVGLISATDVIAITGSPLTGNGNLYINLPPYSDGNPLHVLNGGNALFVDKAGDGEANPGWRAIQVSDLPADAVLNGGVPGGRLSVLNIAYVLSDEGASDALYYVPFNHNKIALWDEDTSRFIDRDISIVGLEAITLGSNYGAYDIFVYWNAGGNTIALSGIQWTDETTRAEELDTQDDILVNGNDHGLRYVGSVYYDSDIFVDVPNSRWVWNMYNRVPRILRNGSAGNDTTTGTSFTPYSSAVDMMVGLSDASHLELVASASSRNNSLITVNTAVRTIGIWIDSSSTSHADCQQGYMNLCGNIDINVQSKINVLSDAGYHTAGPGIAVVSTGTTVYSWPNNSITGWIEA